MREVKCDICGEVITDSAKMGKTSKVKIQKGCTSVMYDCCSLKCEQELFSRLSKHWLDSAQNQK